MRRSRARSSSPGLSQRRPGAIVIGGDYQGLGIVRSLAQHGIPVCVLDDERSIARFSRYTTYAVTSADLRDEDQTVAAILDVGAALHLDGWVLYPTRDETVAALSRAREQLLARFRVPTPAWETVRVSWDKRETYRVASELGIPVPRTWYPSDASALDEIDADPPFAIKPAIKEHFIYATRSKAWRADTRADLRTLFERAARIVPPGEVMVQELIPGGGSQQFAYCAFYKDGSAHSTMVVQRQRQHPPEFGRASTLVQTVELPLLETLSERFLSAIGYYGLVEVEYKLDTRDGAFKLLDVNARTWGYHSLGQRAGVDFSYLLYADQVGVESERVRARPGVRWIRLVTDLPTGLVEVAGGRLHWRQYLRSVRSFDVEAVFSRQDPLPGLVELALIPYLSVKRGF
jgi:predicted ATP-grasp superfamily ATP-dependent carboligase